MQQRILIIKPSSLGDIVHTLPFLGALHQGFPDAEIHWVVARGLHRFLEGHSMITRLWIMDKDKWKKLSRLHHSIPEIIRFRNALRSERFDISIDLSGLLRSGLVTWAAGADERLGFSDSDEGSPFFYNRKIPGGDAVHAIDRYLKLAQLLGCDISRVEHPMPPFPEHVSAFSSLPEEYCIIAPSAGKPANRWPARRFGELAAGLPLPSVVISNGADAPVVEEVVRAADGNGISMAGKTGLKELVSLISRARFFISNDTGPMHIAAALGIPVFALFGPANPVRTGPYGSIHTIIRRDLSCSPCYRQQPCEDWRCMNELSVDLVREIILAKISDFRS
jgi:lipopolysaccharide heptosyltransferase I